MKFSLHIGAHKTASTLLRHALMRNKGYLKRNGLNIFSRKRIIRSSLQKALNDILHGSATKSILESGRGYIQELLEDANNCDILISNEDLFGSFSLEVFYREIEDQLKYIVESLPGDAKLQIVFYTRKQADYIESVYMQHIHLGHTVSFREYLGGELPGHVSWLYVAEKISRVVGNSNIIVKPFEIISKLGAKGYYHDFLKSIGFNAYANASFDETVDVQRSANRSYSELAVRIAEKVTPLLSDPADKKKFRTFLQENFSTATHPRMHLLSEEERSNIFEIYRDSNRDAFTRYMPMYDGAEMGYF